jgi:hypothetical protein
VKESLELFYNEILKLPFSSPGMVNNYYNYLNFPEEIVITGKTEEGTGKDFINLLNQYYMPDKIVFFADTDTLKLSEFIKKLTETENKSAVYICENFRCNLPIYNIEHLKNYLEQKNYKGVTK